jgi:phospholipase D1/2
VTAPLALPGRTCWHQATSPRFSVLIDAEDYYAAVASACEKANDSIVIAGWAIDSRVRLHPGEGPDALPDELGPFLAALVRRRRSLRVRVLAWDVAMVFGLESGFFPVYSNDQDRHARFHWELDAEHALGAATHQKVCVVDDRVAFVTGMDFTGGRWDTRKHEPKDPRRMHAGEPYGPYHDAGLVLDGEPAAALGELMRERWARATGRSVPLGRFRAGIRSLEPGSKLGGVIDRVGAMSHRAGASVGTLSRKASAQARHAARRALRPWMPAAPPVAPATEDRWPDGVAVQATNVSVSLARTEAQYLWKPEIREVELLFLASIAAARRTIFIENQYFSSRTITEALEKRLAEPDGPEIVVIQPLHCAGWLEQATMEVLRDTHLRRLRAADASGRLRVLHPVDAAGTPIYVHSKVMVIDDEILRIGSANVSNRSMALDTELDCHVEALGRDDLRAYVTGVRDDLVGEHLGLPGERVSEAVREAGSLRGAIDALRGEGRTLKDLPADSPAWLSALVPQGLTDPEAPAPAATLLRGHADVPAKASRREKLRMALVASIVGALTVAWALVPLGSADGATTLAEKLEPWSRTPAAPLVALLVFVIGGSVAFPMSVLVVATQLAFGPFLGSAVSLIGGFISAAIGYVQGRVIGRRWLRRLGGRSLNRISRALASHGVLTIAAARVMPFMPWTLTSLAAGASHVRPLDYFLGTMVGLVPGVAVAAIMTDASSRTGMHALLQLGVFALLMGGIFAWGRARIRRTAGA